MNDNAVVEQSTYNGGRNQRWIFAFYFSNMISPSPIRSLFSSKELQKGPWLSSIPDELHALLVQRGVPPATTQLWNLSAAPSSSESDTWLVQAWNGNFSEATLDVPDGPPAEGLQLQVFNPMHGGRNQRWEIWLQR